eukprot:TRINITY_DN35076_c0_g1_i1.p1 TRINITY_DN35076_c0_g1~~TRINITY_DN35076_c0_g1_i1.p1  ORF type:complete len:697 (+),score=100.79 TRINITY_DN35076_c0_g1_i1:93-2183(+)
MVDVDSPQMELPDADVETILHVADPKEPDTPECEGKLLEEGGESASGQRKETMDAFETQGSSASTSRCSRGVEAQQSTSAQDKLDVTVERLLLRMHTHKEQIDRTLEMRFSEVLHALDMMAELVIQMRHRPHSRPTKKIEKGKLSPQAAEILSAYGFRGHNPCESPLVGSDDSPGTGSDCSSRKQPANGRSSRTISGNMSLTSGEIIFRCNPRSRQSRSRMKQVLPSTPDLQEDLHDEPDERKRSSPFAQECGTPMSDVQSILPQSPKEPRLSSGAIENSHSLGEVLRQNDRRLVEAAHLERDRASSSDEEETTPDNGKEATTSGNKYQKSLKKVPEDKAEAVCPYWASLGVWLGSICLRVAGFESWTCASKWNCENRAWRCVPFVLNLLFLASSLVRIIGFGCWENQLLGAEPVSCDGSEVARLFVDVILGLGSCLVLPSAGFSKFALDDLQANIQSLRTFASRRHFHVVWYQLMSWDFFCFTIALVAAWLERMRGSVAEGTMHREKLHLVLFMISSFTVIFAAYSLQCTSRGLKCMVDKFLVQLATSKQYVSFEIRWKVRAALMRRLSSGLEWTFMALGMTATMAVLFGIIDVSNGYRMQLVPPFIVFGCVPCIGWCTAGVTDACQKVPPTINALTHSEVNHGARLLLQSVQASEAGIYIGGTRLSKGVVIKLFYFTSMAVFGISTNLFDLKIG